MKLHTFRTRHLVRALALLALGTGLLMPAHRAMAQTPAAQQGADASERSTPSNAVPAKSEEERDENEAFRQSSMVQKMGRIVGLKQNQAATAFTAVNFLILLAGVGYLIAKSLPKAFRDRSSAIQKHLVEARTATEEAGARLKAVEARLGRLDDDIAAMRRQAEADAMREERRAQEALEQESAKIVAAAETEIQAATAAARRELQRHAAELAVDQAARRLEISPETDRMLVKSFAESLAGKAGGQN